ncbi:MAG: DUF6504 family protein [Maritimibacter sp.]
MPAKRYLSLWFPRLAAERMLRLERGLPTGPFVVVEDQRGAQIVTSLNADAQAQGIVVGSSLRDARAMCPGLVSRGANRLAEAGFLTMLRRWAGQFTPWVAQEPPDALVLDITGCAQLFGGEVALAERIERDLSTMGLSLRLGLADTVGAAWALARFGGDAQRQATLRSGDDINQEARATRSRAVKRRHWTRGGAAPKYVPRAAMPSIAPIGATRQAIAPLPVAALRLSEEEALGLTRLGLRRIEDILGTPRAGLARRFGRHVVQRLDQALGAEPEPVSPARPPHHFAVRLGLPEPIGLMEDLCAALDRLLPELGTRLKNAGRGARRVRAEFSRADHTMQAVEVGLAQPSADTARLRPLLVMKLGEVDAGFGIDMVRLVVTVHEPIHAVQHRGHFDAGRANTPTDDTAIHDLMGRIGARLGLEALTRLHPAASNIPEKETKVLAAPWSVPATDWAARQDRPLRLWAPEPVMIEAQPKPPNRFRWRGRDHGVCGVQGPERILPEWWLGDENWRTGARDYWRIKTDHGEDLWLYYAYGDALSPGWFCQGAFA